VATAGARERSIPLVVIVVVDGAVYVAERVPGREAFCCALGKFVAEMAVHIDEKGGHLEGQQGVGVDGHDEDADVGDARLQHCCAAVSAFDARHSRGQTRGTDRPPGGERRRRRRAWGQWTSGEPCGRCGT
jgi:hypothetical protein